MSTFDVIVLGTGGIGSAALAMLARRGAKVLGLDQFPPAHDRGSSHGRTRIIRQAYFEHPDYVPLLLRSYELWRELSERTGERLFQETGFLQVGPADGVVVPGVLASAAEHGLSVERLAANEITRRWPGFAVAESAVGVYEPRGGVLAVEACVAAHLRDAQAAGAALKTDEPVVEFQPTTSGIVVRTARQEYSTQRLIVTAGPWAGRWLGDLGTRLVVRRKPLFWFATNSNVYRAENGCPAFLYEMPEGVFYGFPEVDPGEIKMAEHSGGEPVDDPLAVDREWRAEDQARLESFIARALPDVSSTRTAHAVCMYTMSPDEHFIVDHHPRDERICFAAGLSGHGFKFAPVLGEVLADLALAGQTKLPIAFLSCRRPALTSSR
ncbi:MAG TPA: N-methyl-L-tryptophan oxidase [Pirellulales bacterium]|nr:N-methyl-L-tryptophan oxidase [Pirellulales bacterium]